MALKTIFFGIFQRFYKDLLLRFDFEWAESVQLRKNYHSKINGEICACWFKKPKNQTTMPKLNVLKHNQLVMTGLGIYQCPPHSSVRLRLLHSITPYFTITSMTVAIILSGLYVYQGYGSARLAFVFEAFALFIGGIEALFAYINMIWKMNQAVDLRLKLQQIVDRGIKSRI